jgi:hypothetical protein
MVTRAPDQRRTIPPSIFMVLAALALAVKVMIPAGFMTAKSPAEDLPFALVLCTAQGAVIVQPGELASQTHDGDQGPGSGAAHDSPCAFAGHAAGAPPPNLLDARNVEFVSHLAPAAVQVVHFAPGRGLAAPPLPARGPPSQLI